MIPRLFLPITKAQASTMPKNGDTIRYEGEPAYLVVQGGRYRIFDSDARRYIELERQRIVVNPDKPNEWIYDQTRKVTPKVLSPLKKYIATVTINGEVTTWDVEAESEGKARNKVLGLVASKLKLTVQGVNALVTRKPNSISIKESKS